MSNAPSDEPERTPADGGSPETTSGPSSGRHAALGSSAGHVPAEPGRARHRQVAARSRRRTAFLGLVAAFVVVLGLLIGAATLETQQLDANVTRVEEALPTADRPAESAGESQTFLLAGVEQVSGSGRPLLDTVLLMHVTGNRGQAQVVSVPVSTWVAGAGVTPAGSFRDGGAAALVTAVEALSDVRVDNYVQVDFAGFQQVIDDLDGVDVDVPEAYANKGFDFPAGRQHLDGAAALAYVRDVGPSSRGTAAVRQQAVITAVFDRVSERGAFSDLGTLNGVLTTLSSALSVDDTLDDTDLVNLAWGMRGIGRPAFVTMPTSRTGEEAGQPVVHVDDARAAALWGFLSEDTLGEHLDEFR